MHQLHQQLGHGVLAAKSRAHAQCRTQRQFQYANEAGRLVLDVRATRSKRLLAPAAKRRKTEVAILAGQQLALQMTLCSS